MKRISVTLYEDKTTFITTSLGIIHTILRLRAKVVQKIKTYFMFSNICIRLLKNEYNILIYLTAEYENNPKVHSFALVFELIAISGICVQ